MKTATVLQFAAPRGGQVVDVSARRRDGALGHGQEDERVVLRGEVELLQEELERERAAGDGERVLGLLPQSAWAVRAEDARARFEPC